MHSHFPRDMGQNLMTVIKPHFERGRRKRFKYFSVKTNEFFGIPHTVMMGRRRKGRSMMIVWFSQRKKRGFGSLSLLDRAWRKETP